MPDPFHVRFNIEVPIDEARRRFVNRIANQVRIIASAICFSDTLDGLLWEIEATLGEPHSIRIEPGTSGEPSFIERWVEIVDGDFLRCLHALEGLYNGLEPLSINPDPVDGLSDAITGTLAE